MERRQLREYVHDEKSPYNEAKLYGERVILYKDKLYIPKVLQERVVNWYYWLIYHPGSTILAKTIQQACNWPKLVTQDKHKLKKYKTCLKFKKAGKRKYVKLLAKFVEAEPWAQVDIDLIVPYSLTSSRLDVKVLSKEITLTDMTFIDPSTGWF